LQHPFRLGRQDYSGGKHRTRQRAAPGFVQASHQTRASLPQGLFKIQIWTFRD
jgi:hypothetical protein